MVIRKYTNGSVNNERIGYEYGYYYLNGKIYKGEQTYRGGLIFKVKPGDQCIIVFSGDTHADSTYVTYYTYGCGSKPTASSPETPIALSVTKKYYSSSSVTQYTFTVPDGVHYICQSTYNSRVSGTNPITSWINVIYILKKVYNWKIDNLEIRDSLGERLGIKYIGIDISGTKTAFSVGDICCSIHYRMTLSSNYNMVIKVKGDQTNNNNFYVKTATNTNAGSSVTLTAPTVTKSYDSVKDETTFAFTVVTSVQAVWFGWIGTDAPSLYPIYCPKAYFSYNTVGWHVYHGNYEDGTWLPNSTS